VLRPEAEHELAIRLEDYVMQMPQSEEIGSLIRLFGQFLYEVG
jgi:hypothetical protein